LLRRDTVIQNLGQNLPQVPQGAVFLRKCTRLRRILDPRERKKCEGEENIQ
jgi:hypothetical protein